MTVPLTQKAYDIHLLADLSPETRVHLTIFGQTLLIDMQKNQVSLGKNTCTISLDRKTVDLRIIADTTSVEVFADGGRFNFAAAALADHNLMKLELRAETPLQNASLSLLGLKSIWNERG